MKIVKSSKVLFLGEHSAVYGFPVIGATIPLKMKLNYEYSSQFEYYGNYSLKIDKVIDYILSNFKNVEPIRFSFESEIPVGIGFGSSASVSLCFAEYIVKHREYSKLNKIFLAKEIEDIFHGKSSGMDIALIEYEGISYFENKNSDFLFSRIESLPFYFLIGAIKRNVSTGEIVCDLKNRINKDEDLFKLILSLGNLTKEAYKCFLKKDIFCLKDKIIKANFCLKNLGLSSNELDYIINKGIEFGALAGKFSGAGCGGIFIFLIENEEKGDYIKEKLKKDLKKNDISLILDLKIYKF